MAGSDRRIGIGMVGYGSMGRAHARAYSNVRSVAPDSPEARLVAISGRGREQVQEAAANFGFERAAVDWREVIEDPAVDIVDICTPPGHHAEVIIAAARAGKSILCEKPLASDYRSAREAVEATNDAGVLAAIGFNYRRLPAVALMKQLVADGRIGTVTHMRAIWLTDEFIDPDTPFDWRFERAAGGTTIADLGSHLIDLAHWIVGEIRDVSAQSATCIRERFDAATGEMRSVEVDDNSSAIVRFADGARGVFEMSRVAPLHPCDFTFELNGTAGSIRFDYARLNELWLGETADEPVLYGMRRIRAESQAHPQVQDWWPAGQGVGYEASFLNQISELLQSWPDGPWEPSLADGLQVQAVCDAMELSASESRWVPTSEIEGESLA